ncbi:MAG TPA: DUF4148 domain-containing protein [Comamonadaceae bacterium]|nr:DUF4148 domain-containing protein [Comamonadaceae bacterium]
MNTARILSIAAMAAFASMGAQAFEPNGELYGSEIESRFQSTRDRAEVRAEGQKALPEFAKGPIADRAALVQSTRERPAVRSEAVTAARAQLIATGERS